MHIVFMYTHRDACTMYIHVYSKGLLVLVQGDDVNTLPTKSIQRVTYYFTCTNCIELLIYMYSL